MQELRSIPMSFEFPKDRKCSYTGSKNVQQEMKADKGRGN